MPPNKEQVDREISAWMKYHTVRSRTGADFAVKDRTVTGYRDPRAESEVRTDVPCASRLCRSLFLAEVAQKNFKLREDDVENFLLKKEPCVRELLSALLRGKPHPQHWCSVHRNRWPPLSTLLHCGVPSLCYFVVCALTCLTANPVPFHTRLNTCALACSFLAEHISPRRETLHDSQILSV